MLGQDGREGDAPAFREGKSLHLAHDFLLHDSRPDGVAGHGMHLVTQVAGGIDRRNLAVLLHQPLGDDRPHKGLGRLGTAGERRQLQGVVVAARRQEMHRAAGPQGLRHHRVQFPVRDRPSDPDRFGPRQNRGLRSHPDDIANLYIVCKERLFTAFQIQNGSVKRLVQTEEIQPGRILTPFIAVILILCRRFGVAQEKDDSFFSGGHHIREQTGPAGDIDFFCKHDYAFSIL